MIDIRVEEAMSQARQRLDASPFPQIRGLELERVDDRIVIQGCVESFYFKQMAQETVLPAAHGCSVMNVVAVESPEAEPHDGSF